jgi:hypothetical protein
LRLFLSVTKFPIKIKFSSSKLQINLKIKVQSRPESTMPPKKNTPAPSPSPTPVKIGLFKRPLLFDQVKAAVDKVIQKEVHYTIGVVFTSD